MPPYSNQQQQDDYVQVLNGTNFDMEDIPLTPNRALRQHKAPAPGDEISWDTTTKSVLPTPPPPPLPQEEEEEKPGMVGKMLDFNLCTAKIPNPHSALFKERRCAECGSKVYKYRNGGYETEVVLKQPEVVEEQALEEDSDADSTMPALMDDVTADSSCCGSHKSSETAISDTTTDKTTGVETKIYFMKSCYIKRQHRKAHKEGGYALVMMDLMDHFAQKELEARRSQEEEELDQLKAAERAAIEEAEREEALAKQLKKERSLKGRTKKAFKSVKKSFSCFSAAAVVAAPQKVQPQSPSRSVVQLSWGDHQEEQTVGDSSDSDNEEQVEEPPLIKRALSSEEPLEEPPQPVQLSWGNNTEQAAF